MNRLGLCLALALAVAAAAETEMMTKDEAQRYIHRFHSFLRGGEPEPEGEDWEVDEAEWRDRMGYEKLNRRSPAADDEDVIYHPEPDSYMNVTELITSKGYGCEQHLATTSDHFVLSIQRVLSPTVPYTTTRVAVILQHGLLDSSTTWVMNQANNSLGFLLADQGFDVWMSNMRGNRYSTNNTKLKPWRREFWDWSWDEMAEYDLPAIVDYVTDYTGYEQVYYVGHSQGTLTALTGFSENSKLEKKVKKAFLLAPIITMGNCEGFLPYISVFHGLVYFWLNLIGHDDILPSTPAHRWAGRNFCGNPINRDLCESCTFLVCGPDWTGYNQTRSDVYDSQFPAGTSLKNINHWAQMILSGKCQKYDYGWFENPFYYDGKHHAPIYNIGKVTVPTALFSGGMDYLADPLDVQNLINTATNAIVYHKEVDYFDHLDFVWGMQATQEVYDEIINQIWAEQ